MVANKSFGGDVDKQVINLILVTNWTDQVLEGQRNSPDIRSRFNTKTEGGKQVLSSRSKC